MVRPPSDRVAATVYAVGLIAFYYYPRFRYAMQKAGDGISIWFWPRDGGVPDDVRNGQSSVNTDAWGTPAVKFYSNSADMSKYFDTHEILFDLTFCVSATSLLVPAVLCLTHILIWIG